MTVAKPPRIAVRAILVHNGRILLVNAWPSGKSDLLCAPGGGVEPHSSLHENLMREVAEETGLVVTVGPLCLVNEFHDPKRGFHQIELFFKCTVEDAQIPKDWVDPAKVVTTHVWATPEDLQSLRVKPDTLKTHAFSAWDTPRYDPLELIVT